MKPKEQRMFKGKGNKDNRHKRDVKRMTRLEKELKKKYKGA